jgi:hypothetical protein
MGALEPEVEAILGSLGYLRFLLCDFAKFHANGVRRGFLAARWNRGSNACGVIRNPRGEPEPGNRGFNPKQTRRCAPHQ